MNTRAFRLECPFSPIQWTLFFQAPSAAMATLRLLWEGQSLFVVVQSLFEGQWGYSPWKPVAYKPLGGETEPLNPMPSITEARKLGQESLRVRGWAPPL